MYCDSGKKTVITIKNFAEKVRASHKSGEINGVIVSYQAEISNSPENTVGILSMHKNSRHIFSTAKFGLREIDFLGTVDSFQENQANI